MAEYFLYYKAFHVISVISWMAAMLYMPRLFAYHTRAKVGSEMDETFKTMEKRLKSFIMTPAMISTYIFGFLTTYIYYGSSAPGGWFHIKMLAVLGLTAFHGILCKWVRVFSLGKNTKSEKFYKIMNEVPTVLMIIIVMLVVIKPFD